MSESGAKAATRRWCRVLPRVRRKAEWDSGLKGLQQACNKGVCLSRRREDGREGRVCDRECKSM